MKNMLMAGIEMAGIIVIQMVLSYVFTWQAGEIFSKVSVGVLFYYSILRVRDRRLKAKPEQS